MKPTLLLTGATGAVGLPLLAALLRSERYARIFAPLRGDPAQRRAELRLGLGGDATRCDRLVVLPADLADPAIPLGAWPAVDVIIHAAASTRFREALPALAAINVNGTDRLLHWAAALRPTPRFIHLSTLCVAGGSTGPVAEQPISHPPPFINAYEHSKWLAERLVTKSPVQPEIVRLGIVAGSELDGTCTRPGALHAALRWMRRGLLPLVPGEGTAGVDLVSTELVAGFICRLLGQPARPGRIYHLTAGPGRMALDPLLKIAAAVFARQDPAWREGQILPPVVAGPAAFASFRRSVELSRDLLFNEVLASADAFLPVLAFPKDFATAHAQEAWGGPLPWPDPAAFAAQVVAATLQPATAGRKEAP